MDAAKPWAEAVAIRGSRIVAVGSNADVRAHAGRRHAHDRSERRVRRSPDSTTRTCTSTAPGALLVGVNLLDVHEPNAFAARMREAAARLPAGSWITRGDWGAYEQWGAGSAGGAKVLRRRSGAQVRGRLRRRAI